MEFIAYFDLELQQMDVKTACLNGDLEEKVYMKQLERFFFLVMVNIWYASLRNPYMD